MGVIFTSADYNRVSLGGLALEIDIFFNGETC